METQVKSSIHARLIVTAPGCVAEKATLCDDASCRKQCRCADLQVLGLFSVVEHLLLPHLYVHKTLLARSKVAADES